MNNQRNKIDQKIFKGKVVDYSHDGRGVIKINKNVIFVPNLLIGEEATVKITKENKTLECQEKNVPFFAAYLEKYVSLKIH